MTNEWKPVLSNNLLEETCTRGTKSPFQEAYEDLKQNGAVKPGQEILSGQVKIDQKPSTLVSSCYFVALESPVTFIGKSKTYY